MIKKKLWIDCESSGIDPKRAGIISLAMLYEENDVLIDQGYWEMKPSGRSISLEALEVNGFTIEQVEKFPSWERVKPDIEMFLDTHVKKFDKADKYVVCGQRVDFDVQFLIEYFKACSDNYVASYIKLGGYVDTIPTLNFLQDLGKVPILENNKLGTICNHFNVDLTNAHNSLDDVKATRECYLRMKALIV